MKKPAPLSAWVLVALVAAATIYLAL